MWIEICISSYLIYFWWFCRFFLYLPFSLEQVIRQTSSNSSEKLYHFLILISSMTPSKSVKTPFFTCLWTSKFRLSTWLFFGCHLKLHLFLCRPLCASVFFYFLCAYFKNGLAGLQKVPASRVFIMETKYIW